MVLHRLILSFTSLRSFFLRDQRYLLKVLGKEKEIQAARGCSLIFGFSNLAMTTHQNFMCSLQSHLEFTKSNYLSDYLFTYPNMLLSLQIRHDHISYCYTCLKTDTHYNQSLQQLVHFT